MNEYSDHFNPDLEAILQEIARDPRAKMLKVPSSGALIYSNTQPQVGIAAPSLTAAEVEVLTVHREELAERLKERCLIEFFREPGAKLHLNSSIEVGRTLEVRDEDEWHRETKQLLEYKLEETRHQIAKDVLKKCVKGSEERSVSITELATAMMRIAPKEQGRLYVALDLLKKGRPSEAVALAQGALEENPSSQTASYAFEILADALWKLGHKGEALEASRDSIMAMETRIHSVLCCIDIAVRSGAEREAKEACRRLDDFDAPRDPAVIRFIRPERMAKSLCLPSRESREWAFDLLNSSGESSKEVLNAILF